MSLYSINQGEFTLQYLRDLRRQVRQTASLISVGTKKIKEQQGDFWACMLDRNTITWTPDSPHEPGKELHPDEVLFLVTHEAGHLRYSKEYSVKNVDQGREQEFHLFVNGLEDIRIEDLLSKDFPGFNQIRKESYERVMGLHKHLKEYGHSFQVALKLISEAAGAPMPYAMHPLAEASLNKHRKALLDIARTSKTTQELAERVLPIFHDIVATENNNQQQGPQNPHANQKGQGQGDGQQGEGQGQDAQDCSGDGQEGNGQGDGQNDGQGSGEGQDQQQSQDSTSGGGGAGMQEPTGNKTRAAGIPSHRHSRSIHSPEARRQAIDSQRMDGRKKGRTAADERSSNLARKDEMDNEAIGQNKKQQVAQKQQLHSVSEQGGYGLDHRITGTGQYEKVLSKHLGEANILGHQLKSKLVNNAMDYWDNGKKRGRLNPRAAHRTQRGDTRIFRTRTQVGTIDYTVGLLVDNSGSMRDDWRSVRAAEATAMLVHALERAGIPHFGIAWGSNPSKEWALLPGDKARTYGDALIDAILSSGGGTFESAALRAAEAAFKKVNEDSKKILFVISDGDTAQPDIAEEVLQDLIDQKVMPFFIGIGMPVPQRYEHGVMIQNASQLLTEIPTMLNRLIRTSH